MVLTLDGVTGALTGGKVFKGAGHDGATDVAYDASGNLYVGGWTSSPDFAAEPPLLTGTSGTTTPDAFVARISFTSPSLSHDQRVIRYEYDGLNRLSSANESGASSTTYGYTYDLAGNRTSVTVNGASQSFSFNAANEVTNAGWAYDAAGNLLNDGTTSATSDALGRTGSRSTGGVTTDYQYNGDGLLVQAGATTYAQDLAAPLSQVLMLGTNPVYYGHERLAVEIIPLNRLWQLHDGLGSVRQTLGGEGGLTGTWRYDPWGSPVGTPPAWFGFAGELQDAGGDVYLRARWYAPQHGVFTARDPFPGWNEQPASQHPYAYALNNPVVYTDPSGALR